MKRTILSVRQDPSGDWVADLTCGHRHHAHPGVISEPARAAHVGETLDCPRCDRFEWPATIAAYKRTPEFTAVTVPAGLLKDHSTKPGVWAKIVVLEGALNYVVEPLHTTMVLDSTTPGTVVPEVLHSIAPVGNVRFYVEFYRVRDGAMG